MAPDAAGAGGLDSHLGHRGVQPHREHHPVRARDEGRARDARRPRPTSAVAHLSADEERLEALELRGQLADHRREERRRRARGADRPRHRPEVLPDGQTIEHALVAGDAVIQLAGESGHAGRRITVELVDIALAPTARRRPRLTARENVELTHPGRAGRVGRTIRAQTLDGTGEAGRGLTSARFAGNVHLPRARPATISREATVGGPARGPHAGFGAIDDATFSGAVRFADGQMTATRRRPVRRGEGTLELSGSEPGWSAPRRERRIAVDGDAHRRDARRSAARTPSAPVKSVLHPEQARAEGRDGEGHEAALDAEAGSAGDRHGRRPALRRRRRRRHLYRERPALAGRNVDQGQHHRHRRRTRRSVGDRVGRRPRLRSSRRPRTSRRSACARSPAPRTSSTKKRSGARPTPATRT